MQTIGNVSSRTLQQLSEDTDTTAKKQTKNQLIHSAGSEMVDTRSHLITAKPLIKPATLGVVKDQAQQIRQLVLLKKPSKRYGDFKHDGYKDNGDAKYKRKYWWEVPEMSEYEVNICTQSARPLPKDVIVDYLSRYLATAKQVFMDEAKQAMRFADDADILFGLPEYAIVLGIVHVIENDKSQYYPSVSKVKEAAEDQVVNWPKPEDMEGWESQS